MDLSSVVKSLTDRFPLRLAEKWDNVGLLVEPTSYSGGKKVEKMLLTIDLTEKVLEEAIQNKVSVIFSYHPPIFSALKRLTTREVKEKIVIKAIENQIAIFSPHTAVDCAKGGVNDWLVSGLGEAKKVTMIQPYSYQDPTQSLKVAVYVPQNSLDKLREELCKITGVATIGNYTNCTFTTSGQGSFLGNDKSNPVIGKQGQLERVDEIKLEFVCSRSKLGEVSSAIHKHHPYETPAWEVFPLEPLPVEGHGIGRLVTLNEKVKLSELVQRIKKHLNLPHVRVAIPTTSTSTEDIQIGTVAICAGAGGEVVPKVKADLYWTGEMRHHDVLSAIANGTSVVLCEHTNTERGYLAVLKPELEQMFNNQVEIQLSQSDADPLVVV